MNLPTGWAVDKFSAKALMAVTPAGAWSIVAILTGFARSVQAFIYLRIALGISEAPLFPSEHQGDRCMVSRTTKKRWPRVMTASPSRHSNSDSQLRRRSRRS